MGHAGRSAPEIGLSDEERVTLARWAGGEGRLAERARIVLACAEPGAVNAAVAAEAGVKPQTVGSWRTRFAAEGLAGLRDRQRGGRPKAALELTAAERAQLERWARRAT